MMFVTYNIFKSFGCKVWLCSSKGSGTQGLQQYGDFLWVVLVLDGSVKANLSTAIIQIYVK